MSDNDLFLKFIQTVPPGWGMDSGYEEMEKNQDGSWMLQHEGEQPIVASSNEDVAEFLAGVMGFDDEEGRSDLQQRLQSYQETGCVSVLGGGF